MALNCICNSLCGISRDSESSTNASVAVVTSDEYKYSDFERADNEIRLLQMSGNDFDLHTYNLDDAPPYLALYYTWGQAEDGTGRNQNHKFRLNLGSKHLYIFENLYQGLMEIQRMVSQMQGPIYVWADAICINQSNVDEVSSQVSIMDQIYSRAATVLVWLGPDIKGEIPQVRDALEKFEVMHVRIAEIVIREGIKAGDVVRRDMIDLLAAVELPRLDDERWRIVLAFFRRTWFRRLWIIQEVALAQKVMVLCGSQTLSWTAIERCAEILNSGMEKVLLFNDPGRTSTSVVFYSRFAGLITHIRKWFTSGILPGEFSDVYKLITGREQFEGSFAHFLLGYLSSSLATDPRDKVLGILGMLKKLLPSGSSFLEVDYRLDAVEIYTKATMKIISDSNWLGLLSLVATAEGPLRSRLPSWVPDFTPTAKHNFSVERDPDFNAAGSYRVDFTAELPHKLAFHGNKLRIAGHRVAIVGSKSESLAQFYDHKVSFENGIKLFLALKGDCKYLPTGEASIDALWKTLIANGRSGMPEADGRASFSSFWLFQFLFLAVLEWNSKRIPVESFVQTLPNLETLSLIGGSVSLPGHAAVIHAIRKREQDQAWVNSLTQKANAYALSFGDWVADRVLFSTQEAYLGIGPESLRDGDEIWITPNGPVPLILRPVHTPEPADRFTLVGECYVHGLMYGELFHDSEPSWQQIYLL